MWYETRPHDIDNRTGKVRPHKPHESTLPTFADYVRTCSDEDLMQQYRAFVKLGNAYRERLAIVRAEVKRRGLEVKS